MSKIIIREKGVVKPLDSEPFTYEALLEGSIAEIPELIPLDDVSAEANVFATLGTQWPVGNGAADILMLASDGVLTIVETKLKRNPESRREVVAQVIEYASYLSSSSLTEISARAGSAYEIALEKLQVDSHNVEEFEKRIEDNLQRGHIRLIVAVDELGEQILKLITFLNAHSSFDIFLLQISAFRSSSVEIFVPTLHGYASKAATATPRANVRWNEERFLEHLRTNEDAETIKYTARVLAQFQSWTNEALWGSGATLGSFNLVLLSGVGRINLAQITTRGVVYINFGDFVKRSIPRPMVDELYASLTAIEGVSFPPSIENKYPPIGPSVLRDSSRLDSVLLALEKFIEKVSAL